MNRYILLDSGIERGKFCLRDNCFKHKLISPETRISFYNKGSGFPYHYQALLCRLLEVHKNVITICFKCTAPEWNEECSNSCSCRPFLLNIQCFCTFWNSFVSQFFTHSAVFYMCVSHHILFVLLKSFLCILMSPCGLEPPSLPPKVKVEGRTQTYQGVDPSNSIALAEGYTGDVTCQVEGGYPTAHNTQLSCGNLVGSGGGTTSTLRFATSHLTREMNGTVCSCTGQHVTGCYGNRETSLTIRVLCK